MGPALQCGDRQAAGGTTLKTPTLYPAQNQNGFTLIELLVVIVIIGVLAAIAIPKFANTKERAHIAAMKSDLRNLVTIEEQYFYDATTYTTDKSAAALNYTESAGVTVTITVTTGPPMGYSATSVHTATAETCAIFISTAAVPPATNEGEPKCT